ncbi:MAG: ferrous iron transporter B [Bacillota bacterium]|nr:ferrous iron transporter B [Bacillota bacterium]
MRIALAGNPNSGKTTLYNALTGKNEYVGNWAGVTVASKEAPLRSKFLPTSQKEATIVDLPGAYSISPYSGEERITRDFVMGENVDVIVSIVDGANFERSLFFTSQLCELGIPLVVALNKADIVAKRQDKIAIDKLEKKFNIKVIETTATEEKGLKELIEAAVSQYSGNLIPTPLEGITTDEERTKYISQEIGEFKAAGKDMTRRGFSDKIDRIVAHPILGLPIFFGVLYLVYYIAMEWVGKYFSDYINETLFGEIVPEAVTGFLEGIGTNEVLTAFIVDGVVAGIGAVLGFLPLIMVLFFLLTLLEDSGYMARIAVLMDRYFKKIGLSGKSIIPMIVGTGCSIPGIMATRTIEDENEKRMTAILAPFVPCGAKVPVIALFSMAFFPDAAWVGPSIYILSFVVIILSGLLLKKMFVIKTQSTFILELPEYKFPSIKHAIVQMFDKAWAFIVKAATIIMVMNMLVWFMQAFGPNFQMVEDQTESILALVGGFIAPVLIPLGFIGWQLAAASVTGFVAKEVILTTFAVLLAAADEEAALAVALQDFFTPLTAYAFLAFNLFTPPCFAAIGAMNTEITDKKWFFRGLGFQIATGYIVAMLINQIGSLVLYGKVASGAIASIIILAVAIALCIFFINRNKKLQPVTARK